MASKGKSKFPAWIDVELSIKCKDKKQLQRSLGAVANRLNAELYLLKEHVRKTSEFDFVSLTDVYFRSGQIFVRFELLSEQQLESLYKCLKSADNKLSEVITSFQNSLELTAGLPRDTNLTCTLHMSKQTFRKCQDDLFQEEKSCDSEQSSATGKDQTHTRQHEQTVRKTFLLSIPYETDNMKIFIHSDTNEYLRGEMKLHCNFKHGIMYEYCVYLPLSEFCEDKYYYNCTMYGLQNVPVLSNFATYKSLYHTLNTSSIQRDIFAIKKDKRNGVLEVEGVKEHLLDICFHCAHSYNVSDACMQIEKLVKPMSHHHALGVVDALAASLMQSKPISSVLFTIAIGKILYSPITLQSVKRLDDNLAGFVIKNVLNSKQTVPDLPVSSKKYIHGACRAMYEVSRGSTVPEICVLNTFYSFYGDTFLRELVQDDNVLRSISNNQSFEASRDLCTKLYKNALHDNSTAKETIGIIIRHVPIDVALRIYSELQKPNSDCSEYEQSIQEEIDRAVKVTLETVLRDLQKLRVSSLDNLNGYLKIISKYNNVWNVYKNRFEDIVFSIIQYCSPDVSVGKTELANIMTDYGLFSMKEDKLKLVKCVISSKNQYILEKFFKLSEHQDMADIVSTIGVETFRGYCEQYLYAKALDRRHRTGADIGQLMTCLCSLWKLSLVSKQEDMHSVLVNVTIGALKKQQFNELLKNIDTLDRVSNDCSNIADVILMYVSARLEEDSDLNERILKMISSRDGRPQLTTKLSADIVNRTLSVFGEVQVDTCILLNFERMVDKCQYWKTVFSCTGAFKDVVAKHENCMHARSCLKGVVDLLEKHEITYDFIKNMEKIANRTDAAKRLLSLHLDAYKVDMMWKESGSTFKRTLEIIQCVVKVTTVLKANEPRLDSCFTGLHNHLKKIGTDLKSGKVSARDCENESIIWKDCHDLPELCKKLIGYIDSTLFWNTCRDIVYEKYSVLSEPNVDDQEGGIRQKDPCELYASVLVETGCSLYHDTWTKLNSDCMLGMDKIHVMFGFKPDVEKEMAIACQTVTFIEPSTAEALRRIYSINSVAEVVGSVEKFFTVFGLDPTNDETYNTAITAFNHLLTGTTENSTFKEVQLALETVFVLVKDISDTTASVLECLKTASTLIQFLKEIVDEDIKNLIDAVEDISEQQVQESTVSALIDVKQFLTPLLRFQSSGKCTDILNILEEHVKSFGPSSKLLPTKIEDCVQNVHNLRSLYNGLANRSEQTKELVSAVLEKGLYCFQLNESNNKVEFDVVFMQNEKEEKRKQATLIDLRSRALLLMNTHKTENDGHLRSGDELICFVRDIDSCIGIAEILFALHIAGHIDYMKIDDKMVSIDLPTNKKRLKLTSEEWEANLVHERGRHFLMNFIHGNQIHILYKYLENKIDEENEKSDTQTVRAIMTFIHPDLNVETVKAMYEKEKPLLPNFDNRSMLHCIGQALHTSFEGKQVHRRLINGGNRTKTLTDLVQPGRLTIVQLDEGSLHTVKTLLSLYINTTHCLPEPSHILFCTRETSWIELELLIQRCIDAKDFYSVRTLFCIAHVEILPGELQFRLVEKLRHLERGAEYLLAVICRGSRNHPFVDELSDCVSAVKPSTDRTVQDIFLQHCSNVHTLTSELAGQGKSSYIKRAANKQHKSVVKLHISGQLRKLVLVDRISSLHVKNHHILHIDIGNVDEPSELDTFLFELVVLKYVSAGSTAVKLGSQNVYIELANTINDSLRNSLHTTVLLQRIKLNLNGIQHFHISSEIHSPAQIVCHYLDHLENGTLDSMDLNVRKPMSARKCKLLLSKYIFKKKSETLPVMHTVINVLADQLKKMSHSSFFKVSRLREMVGNKTPISVKSKLVKAMIDVAVEFATRSVDNCRDAQATTVKPVTDDINLGKPISDAATTIASHTDSMIRWEDSNHLMFVFHSQNIHTLSALYRHLSKVPSDIRNLFESQMKKNMVDFSTLDQAHFQDYLQKIARLNPLPLAKERLNALSLNYALTADNLLKMVLIMLRIKSNIPVLVMGETGCGKTSLIRYLASVCEVDFEVFNIHAGIPEDEIIKCVNENNDKAIKHIDTERWLFLDEINTSDSIGLMSDVICHHILLGHELSPNLIVMAACNPYKLRTTKDISTAGLEGKVKTDELSKLVYRVLPIPEIMVDYVWDFGSLNEKDEDMYIHRMIHDVFPSNKTLHDLFAGLLSVSQSFVRKQEESQYSVSLRDVQRCRLLSKWFLEILPKKARTDESTMTKIDVPYKAMILALAHCYQSRFSEKSIRKEYRIKIGDMFLYHDQKFDDCHESFINKLIKEEQADILRRMKLPLGIARNTALQENVFVILVCIFNKIPIFVVGKPGCSKSLAMQLIKSNLRGKDSEDDFFKTLPQLYCVSFQGSESSTSDGIVKVFKKAENYQDSNSSDEVLSVVILDEIGLAEVSRFNPLKVLHSLLEPEGQSQPNVAVVGISNWALDASKMNRAIHLSRPDMDEEELVETAVSISESFFNTEVKSPLVVGVSTNIKTVKPCESIRPYLKNMAAAYCQYINELRFKHFHGLRDYYSLVKYVSRVFAECDTALSESERAEVVMNGIARNLGGLPEEMQTLYDIFKYHIPSLHVKHRPLLEIVAENIIDPIARHLMLITTGESVLGILDQKLRTMETKQREIMFGSQFEEDLTDDYNYRILSKIILCMEQGLILVLKDLDSIYGSLYDMLNQNYSVIGKKKNCRVALGPYSNPICHVADDFRCIVLVDEGKLDLTDPPFLNRFEKQYLRFSDIIQDRHVCIIDELLSWIKRFSNTNSEMVKGKPLFPIHSEDLIASLVLKMESVSVGHWEDVTPQRNLIDECKKKLLMIMKPEAIVRHQRIEGCDTSEVESLIKKYFLLPVHNGLEHYFINQLEHASEEVLNEGILTVIFTNSNVHTKIKCAHPNICIQVEKLGAFKSEKQLTGRVHMFWNDKRSNHLLIQCNAKEEEHHILLTKLIVERCRQEHKTKTLNERKHVYLIIHLDRSNVSNESLSQLNFLSDWSLVMLDAIETPRTPLPQLHKMSLYEAICDRKPLNNALKEELFWAFSRIRYEARGRDVQSMSKAISRIGDSNELLEILENEIFDWINRQYDSMPDKYWTCEVACNITALQSSSSFVDALEDYIMEQIKSPLAKLIYQIEVSGMLESFFTEDSGTSPECEEDIVEKRTVWLSCLRNKCSVKLEDILNASRPECYTCSTHDCLLRMPCSKTIYEVIETTKHDFIDMICKYRLHCLLDVEEELPVEVYEEVLKQQECFILDKIPDLNDYIYTKWHFDYFEDFCNMTIDSLLAGTEKLTRKPFLKQILSRNHVEYTGGDSFSYVVRLHSIVWAHYDSIYAELSLIDNCLSKMNECESILLNVLSTDETTGWIECINEPTYAEVEENPHDEDTTHPSITDAPDASDVTSIPGDVFKISKNETIEILNDPDTKDPSITDKPDASDVTSIPGDVSKISKDETSEILNDQDTIDPSITDKPDVSDVTSIPGDVFKISKGETSEILNDQDTKDPSITDKPDASDVTSIPGDVSKISKDETSEILNDQDTTDPSITDEPDASDVTSIPGDVSKISKDETSEILNDQDTTDPSITDKPGASDVTSILGDVSKISKDETSEILNDQDTTDPSITEEPGASDVTSDRSGVSKISKSEISEIVNSESGSDADFSEQDDMHMDVHDRLVNCVCKLLLPTTKCIDLHGGISNWLIVVDTTTSLAARVSRNPGLLFSLKACSELAEELIIPFNLDKNMLEHIGCILSDNALDSEVVFLGVMQIIDTILCNKTSTYNKDVFTCCQTLSSYFVRCTGANPNTTIIRKLFELLIENKIPAQCIPVFKVPLNILLQGIDHEMFGGLLKNQNYFSVENITDCQDDDSDCQDGVSDADDVVLKAVNDIVVFLSSTPQFDSPLLVMLVDILENVFFNMYFGDSDSDEEMSETIGIDAEAVRNLFLTCHKSLNSHEPGLQYLACIAFCKCFINYAVDIIETRPDDEQTGIMHCVGIVLTDLMKQGTHSLTVFLFKVLSNSKTFSQLQHFCNKYEKLFKFLLPLQVDTFVQHIHNSLLCIHVREEVHTKCCFCIKDTSSFYKDSVSVLVPKDANEDTNVLIQLFAFGIREFYLRQCHTDLNDSNRAQADILLNEVCSLSLMDEIVAYFKCVIGHDNFKIDKFSLNQRSTQQEMCVFPFVVNLIGLTLAHNASRSKNTEQPILAKALFDPESLNACVLPGFETQLDPWSDAERRSVGICSCRNRIFVSKANCFNCIICGAELKLSLDSLEVEKNTDLEGFPLSEGRELACARNPVTYQVLQFLVKASILGGVAIGFNNSAIVRALSERPVSEVSDVLLGQVFAHWNNIRNHVNVSHNQLASLFHSFVVAAESVIFETCYPCNSIEQTNAFEEVLDKIVVATFGEKAKSLRNLHHRHNEIHQQTGIGRNFENQLFEVEDLRAMSREEYELKLPFLYRLTTSPTKTNFMFELCQRKHQFQLLKVVLAQENQLSLPHHIMNIVMWHLATVANASYMMRKQECLKMSVQEFVYFQLDTMKKDIMKRRFDDLKKSWDILMVELKDTNVGKDMKRIHKATAMVDCLILDEKSVVFRVLSAVIAVQNRFLDSVARIAHSCRSLKSLMKKGVVVVPCVPLTELKTENILNVNIEWQSQLEEESHCNFMYGYGTQIQYDLNRIEEYVAKEVVTGKTYITSADNLPKIIFIDELHLNYASLLKEVGENVAQTELPADIRFGITSRKEDNPKIASELLNHIGVVMTVVKKSKADKEQPLVEFVDSWKSVMGRHFPKSLLPSPESSVKLCHVVALSELLEELCAESIRDGLADRYRDKLDMQMHDHLLRVLKDEHLPRTMLQSLKRFIYRCMASDTADPEKPIRHYLEDGSFWPRSAFEDNKIHISKTRYPIKDLFPDEIMVRHISDCVDVIESESEKLQKDSMKLSGFVRSFQKGNVAPKVQKSMLKKKKAVKSRKF